MVKTKFNVYLCQRCQKGWCLFLIVFSQTTGPSRDKLGRNVHWVVFWKVFLLIGSTQKKQEAQRCDKGCYLLLYVECLFFNQSGWNVFFFIFLIKFSWFFCDWPFPSYKGVKMDPKHPIFRIFISSPILIYIFFRFVMKFMPAFFATRFDLHIV